MTTNIVRSREMDVRLRKGQLIIACKHSWLEKLCITIIKGVVNCQNTRDNGVPRMQQWPLDIPQLHITPHPQLSAKTIILLLYAFHTHRLIKSKLPSHLNSIYLSDIFEEMIHHFSHVGSVL